MTTKNGKKAKKKQSLYNIRYIKLHSKLKMG